MSKGAEHYFFKRWQQLQQFGGEAQGSRAATSFDESFANMKKMTLAMEKAYSRIPKELEVYIQPEATKRIVQSVGRKAGYVSKDMMSKHQLYKVYESMLQAGNGFGANSTLGSFYIKAAEAHRQMCAGWTELENEIYRKYLKPLSLFSEDLKEIKSNLSKIERDRLYLDATKTRKDQARMDTKRYDPTVVRHLNEKAMKQQAELEERAGGIQVQMEQFFNELEDDQILVLANLIATEIEFYRLALDALTEVGDYINEVSQRPMISIMSKERPAAGSGPAVAVGVPGTAPGVVRVKATHDFDATSDDELSFRAGDVLTVTNQDVGEGDWWEAMLDGEVGLIPATFVEPVGDGLGVDMDRRSAVMSGAEPAPPVTARDKELEEKQRREKAQLEAELNELRQQAVHLMAVQEQSKSQVAQAAQAAQAMTAQQLQQALDMAQRQMQSTLHSLEVNQKAMQKTAFKPMAGEFEASQNQLLEKAQQSMEMMRKLVNSAYGPMPDLQLAATDAVMCLQEAAMDTRAMAGTLHVPSDRTMLFESMKGITNSLVDLLQAISPVAGNTDRAVVKATVGPAGKQVARSIGGLLDTVEAIRTSQESAAKEKNAQAQQAADDQMTQLLAAAQSIAKAAQELAGLQAKQPMQFQVHQSMVQEAQQVTAAAAKLVQMATECQRAIAQLGRQDRARQWYHRGGTWTEGLVSAASMVAQGVEDLFAAANEVVGQGNNVDVAKVDQLRAIAQSISGSTMQVVMAGATKNPDKVLQARLQGAGGEVQASVDLLVQTLGSKQYGGVGEAVNYGGLSETQRRRAEIEAQTKVLAAERELERAQKSLMAIRKHRYASGDSTPAGQDTNVTMDDLPPPPPMPEPPASDLQARLAALRK